MSAWHTPPVPRSRRPVRRLATLVLLLVSLDFGNPFVGGAFTFESSADGIQGRRESVDRQIPSAQAPLPVRLDTSTSPAWVSESRSRTRHAPVRLIVISGSVHARSDLPAPSEEH